MLLVGIRGIFVFHTQVNYGEPATHAAKEEYPQSGVYTQTLLTSAHLVLDEVYHPPELV